MVTTAKVLLWGNHIGSVLWNENRELASFQYAPEF